MIAACTVMRSAWNSVSRITCGVLAGGLPSLFAVCEALTGGCASSSSMLRSVTLSAAMTPSLTFAVRPSSALWCLMRAL